MNIPFVKKLYYCPVKSLSFNESKSFEIIRNVGIKYDRCIAFTRGLNRISSDEFNHSKKRNLNFFLTLKNSPYLKKYNFIFDDKKNIIKLYLDKKKLIQGNLNNKSEIDKVEKFIEKLNNKIKKPIYLISNNNLPFFDTTPNVSISLINLNTLRDIENNIQKNIEYERFRGNIIVDKLNPWEEFELINKIITIGNIQFKVDSKIPRCSTTNINPNSYGLDINLPNVLIRKYGHKNVGVYLIPKNSGTIKKGDKLVIN